METKSTTSTRSFVWLFMDKLSADRVQCKICGAQLGYTSSTSNMRRHIQMKHPEQNDTVANHVKGSFGDRDNALNEAIKKYMLKNNPWEYTCSLCLSVFKNVKDIAHLKQHINSKHTRVLKELEVNGHAPTTAANLTANNENDADEEEMVSDLDKEYVPNHHTGLTVTVKTSQANGNKAQNQKFEQGDTQQVKVDKEQRVPVQWGFKRKSSSIIWNFMAKVAPKGTVCQLCNKHFNFDGSTSNMHKHVKKAHPQELEMVMNGGTLDLPSINLATFAKPETKQEIMSSEEIQFNANDAVLQNDETDPVSTHEKSFFKKKPTSIVWHFMARIAHNKTMCRLCKRRFNYCLGCTSNMHKHVKCSHGAELAKLLAGEGSFSIPTNSSMSYPMRAMRRTSFTPSKISTRPMFHPGSGAQQLDYLVNMAVSSLSPCSMFEKDGFAKFVRTLNPKFLVPDKGMLGDAITKLYKKHRNLLQKQLDEAPGISISTEIWTYRETQQYLTVTGHFVSETWDVQSAVLKSVLLDSRYNVSESIATKLDQVIKEYNISDKVKCIVIDNTEQLSAAAIQVMKPHLFCIAHALNVTVEESLKASNDIGYLATRVRDIANYFLHSEGPLEKLKQLQHAENKVPMTLIQDTKSDWISTYKMFKRYTELQSYLEPALNVVSSENILLVAEELELLSRSVQVLEPFVLAAEDMASDSFTTLSKSLPVFEILKQMISNLAETAQGSGVLEYCSAGQFTVALKERIEKCMSVVADRANFLPWAATLLDPRFKHMVLEDLEMKQSVELQLQQLMEPNGGAEQTDLLTMSKTGAEDVESNISLLWSSFDETIMKSVREEPVDELQRYVEERPITRQENPFKWWMEREHLYPKLCKIVKQYLCIPATSVPSSQIFSGEERRILSLRNFIEESQIDSFLFLRSCQIVT